MSSRQYWLNRYEAIKKQSLLEAEEYTKLLRTEYNKALRRIEKDINDWYMRLAVNNKITYREALLFLNNKELKEFRWTVDDYIKFGKENAINQKWLKQLENASAKAHITRLDSLKFQIKNELEVLAHKNNRGMNSLLGDIYKNTGAGVASSLRGSKGLPNRFGGLDKNKIKLALNKPWSADSRTFSDRIWSQKEKLNHTLQTELTQGIIRGEAPDRIINTISQKFDVSKGVAGRLVMTESAYITTTSKLEMFKKLGVKQYEILSTLDYKTSEVCQDMDGKIFPVDGAAIGINCPPLHPNCRSTIVAYFDDDLEEEPHTRIARNEKGKNYEIQSSVKYREWRDGKHLNDGKLKFKKLTDDMIFSYDVESDLLFFKLNSGHQLAWTFYTSPKSRNINNYLHKLKSNPTSIDPEIQKFVDRLDKICQNFDLRDDVRVYRAVMKKHYLKYKVGDVIKDGLFYSTSVKKEAMLQFKEKHAKDYIFIIDVPAGTECVYIGENSLQAKEKELLLNYKLRYKIKKIKGNVMWLEVLND